MREVKEHSVRKQEFIDHAIELFVENGYEKTIVEKIIERVGVAKGSFYQ